MSILLVEVLPQGLVFGANRNVTFTKQRAVQGESITIEIHGQNQRPKVLRWPNRKALVGYVGVAEIGGIPTDEWLYALAPKFQSFADWLESPAGIQGERTGRSPKHVFKIVKRLLFGVFSLNPVSEY